MHAHMHTHTHTHRGSVSAHFRHCFVAVCGLKRGMNRPPMAKTAFCLLQERRMASCALLSHAYGRVVGKEGVLGRSMGGEAEGSRLWVRCVNRRNFQKQWNQYSEHQLWTFVPTLLLSAFLCPHFFTSSTSLCVDACYTVDFVCYSCTSGRSRSSFFFEWCRITAPFDFSM